MGSPLVVELADIRVADVNDTWAKWGFEIWPLW